MIWYILAGIYVVLSFAFMHGYAVKIRKYRTSLFIIACYVASPVMSPIFLVYELGWFVCFLNKPVILVLQK